MTQLTLPHRRLQPLHHPVLQPTRTRDDQLHFPPIGAHQLGKLLTDPLQQAEPIVLRQRLQEVLDGAALVSAAGMLFQLRDDGGLVGCAQGRRVEDGGEFAVGFQDRVEGGQGFGDGV